MTANARNCRAKEQKLLRLYSMWHETNRDELKRECLSLLGEILAVKPGYQLRQQFQQAF